MRHIVVTGVSSPVGHQLLAHLPPGVAERVVGIDLSKPPPPAPNFEWVAADTRSVDLLPLFAGADAVVNLAWAPTSPRGRAEGGNVDTTRRVLAALTEAGVAALVHVSSAAVYGAWPDNAVPLTEEAALRPNPGLLDAIHHAEAERLIADWVEARPDRSATVLRPATALGPGSDGWLAEALVGRSALRPHQTDPPRQFVHVDDVASAIALALQLRLDGIYNVAPDGWVAGDVMRRLSASRLNVPLPRRLAAAAAGWAFDLHLSDLPPALLPLIEYPWVVANDRLRAAGWTPRHSNEEAVVAGRPGSRWREMNPARRQEVALIGAAGTVVGAGVAVALLLGRRRRHRRQRS